MRSFACMKNILLYRIAPAALFYCPAALFYRRALLPRCAKRGTVSRAVPILVYKALFSSVCPAFSSRQSGNFSGFVHFVIIFLVVAAGYALHPVFMLEVPGDGLAGYLP